jgi:hypothetical protein
MIFWINHGHWMGDHLDFMEAGGNIDSLTPRNLPKLARITFFFFLNQFYSPWKRVVFQSLSRSSNLSLTMLVWQPVDHPAVDLRRPGVEVARVRVADGEEERREAQGERDGDDEAIAGGPPPTSHVQTHRHLYSKQIQKNRGLKEKNKKGVQIELNTLNCLN